MVKKTFFNQNQKTLCSYTSLRNDSLTLKCIT